SPRASSRTVGSRTPVTTTGARVSVGTESGCWARAGEASRASTSAPASNCGLRIADCGFEGRASNAQSAIANPQSVKRIQPRNLLPHDHRADVVRPLAGLHRLELREVPHPLIRGEDAAGSEQTPRFPRNVRRDLHDD